MERREVEEGVEGLFWTCLWSGCGVSALIDWVVAFISPGCLASSACNLYPKQFPRCIPLQRHLRWKSTTSRGCFIWLHTTDRSLSAIVLWSVEWKGFLLNHPGCLCEAICSCVLYFVHRQSCVDLCPKPRGRTHGIRYVTTSRVLSIFELRRVSPYATNLIDNQSIVCCPYSSALSNGLVALLECSHLLFHLLYAIPDHASQTINLLHLQSAR